MKYNIKRVIFFTLLICFFPTNSFADIVTLKNGKKVTAQESWAGDEKIYCIVYGEIISFDSKDVLSVQGLGKKQPTPKLGFKFDVWQSGINVQNIFLTAKKNNIPLHKSGLISANENFNPVVSSKYADTATQYNYRTELLGEHATVDLFLTPLSKRLYKISIKWVLNGIKSREEFQNEIMDMVNKKYGSLKSRTNQITIKRYYWEPSSQLNIEIQSSSLAIVLTYKDTHMIDLYLKEIETIKNKKKLNTKKQILINSE